LDSAYAAFWICPPRLRVLDWAIRNPDAGAFDDDIEKVAAVLANYA